MRNILQADGKVLYRREESGIRPIGSDGTPLDSTWTFPSPSAFVAWVVRNQIATAYDVEEAQ